MVYQDLKHAFYQALRRSKFSHGAIQSNILLKNKWKKFVVFQQFNMGNEDYHILDMTLVAVLPLEAGDGPEEHDSYFIQYNTCVLCIIYGWV